MSTGLTATARTEFDAMVKAAYQQGGKLGQTVRRKTGVIGSTAKFRKYSKGQATPRIPQTDVVPMGTTYATATATIADWNAPEYTDVFDQQKTDVQERQVVATNIAAAIGRREDQLILDQLDTANASANVDESVGGSNTGMNVAKFRKASRILKQRAVTGTEKTILMHAIGEEQMLGETQVGSADYNTARALVSGELNGYMGLKPVVLEDRDEGGLPLASNIRKNYAYDKMAMALAIGIEFRTEVNYVPEKTSWLANGLFSAGACVVDALGVVEISSYEA